jgi:hypothetical protein
MKIQDAKFEALYKKAWAAGVAAATGAKVAPMVVGEPVTPFGSDIDFTKQVYVVEGGACGFAWVSIRGNTAFGKWAKKNGKARNGYPSGLAISIHAYNQSLARKEAHAYAMAEVLNEAGIKAYGNSRMD